MAKKKSDSENPEVETKKFQMEKDGKKFIVVAPVESLDEDGQAEEALQGIYRSC